MAKVKAVIWAKVYKKKVLEYRKCRKYFHINVIMKTLILPHWFILSILLLLLIFIFTIINRTSMTGVILVILKHMSLGQKFSG